MPSARSGSACIPLQEAPRLLLSLVDPYAIPPAASVCEMSPLHAPAIFGAGIAAGTINTVVGSGTLITFPVLLAFGYPPVTANVSNTVGLVPGSVSGAAGYRRELEGQRARLLRFAIAST